MASVQAVHTARLQVQMKLQTQRMQNPKRLLQLRTVSLQEAMTLIRTTVMMRSSKSHQSKSRHWNKYPVGRQKLLLKLLCAKHLSD